MDHAVVLSVAQPAGARNRLTTAFRPLLAIPHIILVGPVYWTRRGGVGLLGAAAYVMAVFAWFTLMLRRRHPAGIRDFALYYIRWRTRALAYMALFTDDYPPFGDGPYPVTIEIRQDTAERRDIQWRLLMALPHVFVLIVLLAIWFVTTVVAWFAILVTGRYPRALFDFGVGVMQWALRVEAYLLLLTDDYPPFELKRRAVPVVPAQRTT